MEELKLNIEQLEKRITPGLTSLLGIDLGGCGGGGDNGASGGVDSGSGSGSGESNSTHKSHPSKSDHSGSS